MTIQYHVQVLEDLKEVTPLQARMLLDYFENKYTQSKQIFEHSHVFQTGPWRILFYKEDGAITVLRIIQ